MTTFKPAADPSGFRQVYPVGKVNRYVRNLLAADELLNGIWIRGELSNFKNHSSGHKYFSIKDAEGAVAAVMFAYEAASLRFVPSEGMAVEAYGYFSLYEKTGQFQFYVQRMEPVGRGSLFQAFEALKAKLSEEGLFDEAHKKLIPRFPRRIGIVTSATGAALQDILQIAGRRNPGVRILLAPAQVQGQGAAETIVSGIRRLDAVPDVDVIIVGRGGGSIEDLWPFNEETVARAIYAAETPIVSAVGHEIDFTISDFVSDLRAPTPSAAAELTVPDRDAELFYIAGLREKMERTVRHSFDTVQRRVNEAKRRIGLMKPSARLKEKENRVGTLRLQMKKRLEEELRVRRFRLEKAKTGIMLLNPELPLGRGYAYVTDENGRQISGTASVKVGERLNVRVYDGILKSRVEAIEPGKTESL